MTVPFGASSSATEAEALERAVRENDPLRLHAVAVGDPFAERPVTAGGP
jgi:hypothetical protein